MEKKLKICHGCSTEKLIWKNHNGKKYCKDCWYAHPDKGLKSLKASKPINKVSGTMEKKLAAYSSIRKIYLKDNLLCKAKLPGCMGQATDIHHMAGRGKFLLYVPYFLAVCRICHSKIESDHQMAKELGFSLSREEQHNKKDE